MNDKQHIWRLISRRMTGEATPAELLELQSLLQNNPNIQYFMETLRELWQSAENRNDRDLEELYQKHLLRMEEKTKKKNPRPVFNGAVLNNYFKVIVRNLSRY